MVPDLTTRDCVYCWCFLLTCTFCSNMEGLHEGWTHWALNIIPYNLKIKIPFVFFTENPWHICWHMVLFVDGCLMPNGITYRKWVAYWQLSFWIPLYIYKVIYQRQNNLIRNDNANFRECSTFWLWRWLRLWVGLSHTLWFVHTSKRLLTMHASSKFKVRYWSLNR